MEDFKERWKRVRNVSIVQALAKLGHFPAKTTEKEAWFLSPLRSENHASFSVCLRKNLWFDFGIGKGGSVIDLIMVLNDCSSREALEYLEGDFLTHMVTPVPEKTTGTRKGKNSFLRAEEISHPALLQYLRSRRIPLQVARQYCKEIHYSLFGKHFFSVGMKNDLGGWELRNRFYKNSITPKTYSLFTRNADQLIVTEGMFDLLSLAVLKKELVQTSDCLVLNSLAFVDRMEKRIPEYQRVLLFLDQDASGKNATDQLISKYSSLEDGSTFYNGYEDCNDFLLAGKKIPSFNKGRDH